MNHIATFNHNEAIQKAMELIPKPLHRFMECDYILGESPVRLGLHSFEDTDDGRSYHNTAHVYAGIYQIHLPLYRRANTVIIPTQDYSSHLETWEVVVHELGHIFDYRHQEQVGTRWWFDGPTTYGLTNREEAWAESFCVWMDLPGYRHCRDSLDPDAEALFNRMCRY